MRRYEGKRKDGVTIVTVNSRLLNPRLDLRNHSPDGFEWGYGGSGPAQLALALLADYFGDDDRAVDLHQSFKWAIIAKLPKREWILTGSEIRQAVETIISPTK